MLPTVQQALKKIIRSQPNSATWAAKVFQTASKKNKLTEAKRKELIRLESEIGSKLFGQIPAGHRREFFCLDARTWVWHEEWSDNLDGSKKIHTVRYEVRDNGILKSVNGQDYAWVAADEAENLAHAAVLYHQYVASQVYGQSSNEEELPKMALNKEY
ncbi:MAG: hypothetical protein H6799_02325 [Candidatus Nomurabacteria bacterium]|nr:MAG: hypothetical protein H6799_02325 [Candidatus Nomurabacteria bacterium]HRV75970.1 hypothetical protein [Candidatus Saccharimonadales bacterium]